MLAIPRPVTRGDCLAEARPCPWVGCQYHLLLDVAKAGPSHDRATTRAPGLVLSLPRARGGRRQHLRSSAAAALVETWIDDALEQLAGMVDTCALDVADRGEARPAALRELLARGRVGTREAELVARATLRALAEAGEL